MRKFLFYVAVTGWTLGLLVHFLAIADIDVTRTVPFVRLLHVGIFVVWIPAMLFLRNNEELTAYRQSVRRNRKNPWEFYKILFRPTPTWLTLLALGGFLYAIVNFMLFMASQPGAADLRDGQYVLHNHGQLIRTLTEQEYHHYKANEVRGFSGHWVAFYGLAAALLFPFKPLKEND